MRVAALLVLALLAIEQKYPKNVSDWPWWLHTVAPTNDLRYESNDSRDMLNGSFSSKAHLCSEDDVVDLDAVVPQKLFFSVGEGGR